MLLPWGSALIYGAPPFDLQSADNCGYGLTLGAKGKVSYFQIIAVRHLSRPFSQSLYEVPVRFSVERKGLEGHIRKLKN